MWRLRYFAAGFYEITGLQKVQMNKETKERKLPDALEHEFTIADETVNRNGWRLIVAGIRTEAFEKNPVCVVQHNEWAVPVGRWVSLKKEGGVLKGRLQFDRNDEEAVRLYWKYADGYMSAVSLNVVPLVESEDKKDLLPGQRYATVTESELLEISLVTIPAYGNSVRLSHADGREYKASLLTSKIDRNKMEQNGKTVEQLTAELTAQKKLSAENLIKYHRFRQVVGDGEVDPLRKLAEIDYSNVSAMLDARTPAQATPAAGDGKDAKEVLADTLVKAHFDRGAITEAEKPVFRTAALADYEGTRKALEARPGTQQAKDFAQGLTAGANAAGASDERAKWTYLDFYKKDLDALKAMKTADSERYKKLEAAFIAECKAEGIAVEAE